MIRLPRSLVSKHRVGHTVEVATAEDLAALAGSAPEALLLTLEAGWTAPDQAPARLIRQGKLVILTGMAQKVDPGYEVMFAVPDEWAPDLIDFNDFDQQWVNKADLSPSANPAVIGTGAGVVFVEMYGDGSGFTVYLGETTITDGTNKTRVSLSAAWFCR